MLDCLGRELMIKRKYGVDESGWPGIFEQLRIKRGQKVRGGSTAAAGGAAQSWAGRGP